MHDLFEDKLVLPPPGARTWGSRMKAAVVMGIRAGLISREQAYADYLLSPEELAAWEAAFDRGGHKELTEKSARRRKHEKSDQYMR